MFLGSVNMRRKPYGLFLWLMMAGAVPSAPVRPPEAGQEKVLVRIKGGSEAMDALRRRPMDFASPAGRDRADAVVSADELGSLLAQGYKIEILQRESDFSGASIDLFYHTYDETVARLLAVAQAYPQIVKLEEVGQSARFGLPIWAAKISDHPAEDEDEPAFLVDGMHHAREPLGNEICLALLDHLVSGYGRDSRVTGWVDDGEIWIIPVINPEGFKYITDNALASPWWRKNLRDNNGNGLVDPGYDGVDLNRNYDFNWSYGGSTNPADWTYRGPSPFSEAETKAKRDLAVREKFVASLTFHSYGEVVLYEWSWPGTNARTPEDRLIRNTAAQIAGRIAKKDGRGTYDYEPQGGYNQSSPWIYGTQGTLEFLVETGTSFIPLEAAEIQGIVHSNLQGIFYLLDRIHGPGVTGRVRDAESGAPLKAAVAVRSADDFRYVEPRSSDGRTGRFRRILDPGRYELAAIAPGYRPAATTVDVADRLVAKDIFLAPIRPGSPPPPGNPATAPARFLPY